MSNSDEIRGFLTTRRAKITPERAGLPRFGLHRRVSGLRREEVALVAGISVECYTRLERGNAGGVSDDVLYAVSGALQLDDAERAHLLDLVRAANEERARDARPSQRYPASQVPTAPVTSSVRVVRVVRPERALLESLREVVSRSDVQPWRE